MFETLNNIPPDSILKLIDLYLADNNPDKVDLGVGVYQDDTGTTPIFSAIKKAELIRNETEKTKTYFSPAGEPLFNEEITKLILGEESAHIKDSRVRSLQTPGGCGGLSVAGNLLFRTNPEARIWVSSPTWANHVPLLSTSRLELKEYSYYDRDKNEINADAMFEDLKSKPQAGDVVLIHGLCHNPTGADLNKEEWAELTRICNDRGLLPFIDIAYHGFATGVSEDLTYVREMLENVDEALLVYSCSKNFGLYRERTGALLVMGKDMASTDKAFSNAYNIARTGYSVPPNHGAALVSIVLTDDALRQEWLDELIMMKDRVAENRRLLAQALNNAVPDRDFSFIEKQKGMFSLLGVTPDQVNTLINDYSIFFTENSRINLAGVKETNAAYIADSVAKVLT
jgi:aspartate aminotransferase